MNIAFKPKDYKTDVKPVWCPGCGDFATLSALTRSLAYLKLPKENVAMISGIGCSSRLPAYIDSYGFHGVHGRALALAQGLKAARPDLTVIAAGGDGDGFSIGGNHFLHACRRNMDLTYIVMDNQVYGMTKGQPSPTTEPEWVSKMAPHGTRLRPFQPLAIALASGASYIARGFAGDPKTLTQLIVEGIQHRGFAFIEVLSPCPTYRPEHKQWKLSVQPWPHPATDDPVKAAGFIHGDDGLSTGLILQRDLPVWQPVVEVSANVEDIAEDFAL
jgi:2-oxoglutarate ferredoxin oxidoreductase subunit beta